MGDVPLFRVAAGPRVGFGHLVRAVSLCRALGVEPVVALRGGRVARATARELGCALVDSAPLRALHRRAPSVLVVDDPNATAAQPWVRAAHRLQIPVAAIRDRGIGAQGVDLVIDGSPHDRVLRRGTRRQLLGTRFMVLDPVFSETRARRVRSIVPGRVAVVLGGGVHAGYAREVAEILERTLGPGCIQVAPGFSTRWRGAGAVPHPRAAHVGFLAGAEVALVGGGVGLYEACCLGIPAVAVAVTSAQRPTVREFAKLGAVVDGGLLTPASRATQPLMSRRLARQVLGVLEDRNARTRLASSARRVVDGRGGFRVAAALRRLAAHPRSVSRGGAS